MRQSKVFIVENWTVTIHFILFERGVKLLRKKKAAKESVEVKRRWFGKEKKDVYRVPRNLQES